MKLPPIFQNYPSKLIAIYLSLHSIYMRSSLVSSLSTLAGYEDPTCVGFYEAAI